MNTTDKIMALANTYASSNGKALLEKLYGTSQSYTEQCAAEAFKDREALREAIEALVRYAEQKPPSWTAVSDAMPEAGTVVLACYQNGHGNIRRVRAAWVAAKTLEATDEYGEWAEYDEDADAYYCPQGWYERVDNWDEMSHVAITEGSVTHWMPLPPAPAAAMQEKQS